MTGSWRDIDGGCEESTRDVAVGLEKINMCIVQKKELTTTMFDAGLKDHQII